MKSLTLTTKGPPLSPSQESLPVRPAHKNWLYGMYSFWPDALQIGTLEKRVEMNDDGIGIGISCENLKVRDTCTSSHIACLTRWAPGKQVQILSVLLTRSVWSITLWKSTIEWKSSHRDLPENRGRPRSFRGSSPPCHDRAPVRKFLVNLDFPDIFYPLNHDRTPVSGAQSFRT